MKQAVQHEYLTYMTDGFDRQSQSSVGINLDWTCSRALFYPVRLAVVWSDHTNEVVYGSKYM
jgi:hypothetical protein